MNLFSYVVKTVEQGGWTGVCRFDQILRRIFPEMKSLSQCVDITKLNDGGMVQVPRESVVITDNHLSLDVPKELKVIVVQHGCGKTHFDRDPAWRTPHTQNIVSRQVEMFRLSNRTYVAPSWWVGREFGAVCPRGIEYSYSIIPHWVEPIAPLPKSGRPVIIGDWRDNNKGSGIWKQLAARCPQWEFQPLSFRDNAGRREQYGRASLYLCLSLSEGGAFSVCDAEAASLPIVMTDVGNCREFSDAEIIRWQDRDNLDLVIAAIERKLKAGRRKPPFYADYTFERWAALWHEAVA